MKFAIALTFASVALASQYQEAPASSEAPVVEVPEVSAAPEVPAYSEVVEPIYEETGVASQAPEPSVPAEDNVSYSTLKPSETCMTCQTRD
jgi:hypothetical protein